MRQKNPSLRVLPWFATLGSAFALVAACGGGDEPASLFDAQDRDDAQARLVKEGREIFRFDTFGDEIKWTDTLRMHEVIAAAVDPLTALSVGLKVDADALPAALVEGIRDGSVNLGSPATTVTLIKLDAVVGLKGTVETVNGADRLVRVGVTCALCHSTVDDSFMAGIGRRLDGWPNRDLNPGAIIALSPAVPQEEKDRLNAWGKGFYDPRHNIDGLNKPVVIPPAFGLKGLNSVTFTGDGNELAYWNRYVAVTQMGGQGTFTEPRLNLSITNGTQDLVTSKLAALQAYQLSIAAPKPPPDSFDAAAAARGKKVFDGAGGCASCHAGKLFSDGNERLHPPADSMAEPEVPSYASRSATKLYRTTPLRGVWQHAPYFHDGSAASLEAVVQTYDTRRGLGLSVQQQADLVHYLKSL